jgi:hypothetical protein
MRLTALLFDPYWHVPYQVQTVVVDKAAVQGQWQRQSIGGGNSSPASVASGGGQWDSSSGSDRGPHLHQAEQQEWAECVEEIAVARTVAT